MKPSLYRSAMEGNVAELGQHKDVLDGELTPNHNTVLHVAVQFGHLNYVKGVLEACPSLLRRPNVKGETPLHTAAREGRAGIVKAMIARAKRLEEELESGLVGAVKEMLRATNLDGDTALHMAARNCHLEGEKYLKVFKLLTRGLERGQGEEVVEMIMRSTKLDREEVVEIMRDREQVEEIMRATKVDRNTALHMLAREKNRDAYLEVVKLLSKEDAGFQHLPNNFQETPLYLAAERGIMGVAIVETLVETYRSLLTYSGPGGRTALHAAALKDSTGRSTKKLLEWKKDLINQADAKEEADDKENRDAFDHSRNLFQTLVVVAALIATITFAAAFTIPGGYDGNQGRDQGMAILARAAAFKAFVITNTIAMVCSLTSIFLCLSAVMYGFWPEKAANRSSRRYVGAWDLIVVSMFFLMIAFIAATFAVMTASSTFQGHPKQVLVLGSQVLVQAAHSKDILQVNYDKSVICGVDVVEIQLGSLGLWADAALCCYNAATPGFGFAAEMLLLLLEGPLKTHFWKPAWSHFLI
ncbi:hypothetical protein C3L33_15331, partial [Rhododendron williamsianum]